MRRLIARLVSRRVRELEAALKDADSRAAALRDTGRILARLLVKARTENRLLNAATDREVAPQ